MTRLTPGTVTDATNLTLTLEPVSADQVVAGSPRTGSVELDEDAGLGVWEMTPGAMSDVEIDEVFVVLAGSATVAFIEPALPSVELRPGSLLRLESGMRTVWTVRETLRKVYIV